MGIHQTGIAQHMAGINGFVSGNIQILADFFNKPVFAVDVGIGQQAIVIVAGNKL